MPFEILSLFHIQHGVVSGEAAAAGAPNAGLRRVVEPGPAAG